MFVLYSVSGDAYNLPSSESSTEMPREQLQVSPGEEVTLSCPQSKSGDRVSWSAEDKSGRKIDIYDGYKLNPDVSGYSINNSSGVCSLVFVATRETAMLYTCTILRDVRVNKHTMIILSDAPGVTANAGHRSAPLILLVLCLFVLALIYG